MLVSVRQVADAVTEVQLFCCENERQCKQIAWKESKERNGTADAPEKWKGEGSDAFGKFFGSFEVVYCDLFLLRLMAGARAGVWPAERALYIPLCSLYR